MSPTCDGIIRLADLHWDESRRLTVRNNVVPLYRHMDLTREAISLHRFLEATLREELEPNIDFMVRFEEARAGIEEWVEWPSSQITLFIQLCHQNGGILSRRRRNRPEFQDLSPELLSELEACVCQAFGFVRTTAEPEEGRSTGSY